MKSGKSEQDFVWCITHSSPLCIFDRYVITEPNQSQSNDWNRPCLITERSINFAEEVLREMF